MEMQAQASLRGKDAAAENKNRGGVKYIPTKYLYFENSIAFKSLLLTVEYNY